MNINNANILDVTPCNLLDVCQGFPGIYSFHLHPEDGGNRFFRKVGKDLPDYTLSHVRA
jgi:hypothetical protein